MHKKFVRKKDRQFGPYYYTTIRDKSGKIKSFYLGQDRQTARLREKKIKEKFYGRQLSHKFEKLSRPVLPYVVLVVLIAISLTLLTLQFRPTGLLIGVQAASYEKIQDDPAFDVIIESYFLDGNNLIVNFYHNSSEIQPITIRGNVTYYLSTNQSAGNDTVQLVVSNWSGKYFELKVGNNSEIIAFFVAEEVLPVEEIQPQNETLPPQNVTEQQNISASEQPIQAVNYEKIDSDPAFDLIIDSVASQGSTLIVTFHHTSAQPQPIAIDGDVAYELSKDIAEPNEQIMLNVFSWSEEQYFEIKVGNQTEAVGFGRVPEYEVTTEILNAAGQVVPAEVEFIKPETGEIRYRATGATTKAKRGQYDVRIRPAGPVKEIGIKNVDIKANISDFIRLDDVPETAMPGAVEIYAIDPTALNFTEAKVTVTAKGTELWKCATWNFTSQICEDPCNGTKCELEQWIKIKDINPGEEYIFNLTLNDPAYAEYNSTLGAPKCTISASPCIAGSILLKCNDNQASPGPEPNYPNTIDTCTDSTTSGTCHSDESIENITITDLNNSYFRPGDTVNVTFWMYCYSTANRMALYYTNSTSSIGWQNKLAGTTTCVGPGYRSRSVTFTLDNVTGEHAVRAIILYNANIDSACPSGNYRDQDDVAFPVTLDTTAPVINSINDTPDPVNQGDNITITSNATDDVAVDIVLVDINGINYTMTKTNQYSNTTQQVNTGCYDSELTSASSYEFYSKWSITGSGEANVTSIGFWQHDTTLGSGEKVEMAIYNSDGTRIANSLINVSGTGASGWTSANYSTPVTITLGQTYYIGLGPVVGTYDLARDGNSNCADYLPNEGTYYATASGGLDLVVPTGSKSANHYTIPQITYQKITGIIGQYVYNTSALSGGLHNYTVYVNDTAGNNAIPMTGNFTVTVPDSAPSTVLVLPLNGSMTTIKDVNFICNATDDLQLSNITFYWNYSGSWLANGTVSVSGTSNQTTFQRTNLNNGAILWNCQACDNASQCNFAPANWTVIVNYSNQAPQIVLNLPANSTQFNNTQDVNFNFTAIDDNNITLSCSIYLDSVLNKTNASTQNNTLTNFLITGIGYGNHNWYINCTDGSLNNVSETRSFIIEDTISPTYSSDADDSGGSVIEGTIVNISVLWQDNNALDTAIFRSNETGTWQNVSTCLLSGTNSWCNTTINTTGDAGKTICWNQWANDSAGNLNNTMPEMTHCFNVVDMPPQWSGQSQNNSEPAQGEVVLLSAYWTDDVQLSSAILETNETGTWANKTAYGSPMALTGTAAWSNFTWSNSSVNPDTVIGWRVWVNDSGGNYNVTSTMTFRIRDATPPQFVNISATPPSPATYIPGQNYSFQVNWTDDVAVDTVLFESNFTGILQNTTAGCSGPATNRLCVINFTNLGVGTYQYRWIANDTSGNYNETGVMPYVILDNTPPTVTIIRPENITYNTQSGLPLNYTVTDNVAVDSCWYALDGGANVSLAGCSNTTFSVPSDGSHNVRVYANDTSGNVNSSIRYFTVDTVPPQWSDQSQNNSEPAQGEVVLLSAYWTDNINLSAALLSTNETGSWENKSAYGSPLPIDAPSGWSNFTWANASVAQNAVVGWRVWANDSIGNWNVTDIQAFKIKDTVPPVIGLNSPPEGYKSSSATITFNCTASDNINLVNVTLWGNWSAGWHANETNSSPVNASPVLFTKTISPDGDYVWNCQAYDSAGNSAFAAANRSFRVDTALPTIVFISPTPANNTLQNYNWATINTSVTDNFEADSCLLEWAGINETMTKVGTGTAVSCWSNKTGLADSSYTYRVWANDSSNNWNVSETRVVRIDTIAPVIQFVSPTEVAGAYLNRNYIQINVTATDTNLANITVRLYNSTGSLINSTTTTISPNFANFSSLADGVYYFNATAFDSAGNSNSTETRNITLDTINPLIYYNPSTTAEGNYSQNWIFVNITCSDINRDAVILNWNGTNESFDNNVGDAFWENKTGLADGGYSFYAWCTDTASNSNQTATRQVSLDTTAPAWSGNTTTPTTPTIYSPTANYQFNITWTDARPIDTVYFEHNFTGSLANYTPAGSVGSVYFYNYGPLAAGGYIWRSWANDSLGNANLTDQFTYTVNKAATTTNLTLNSVEANLTITYPQTVTAEFWTTTPLTATLYRNGTNVSDENGSAVTLAAGYYNYTAVNPGNQNYSTSSKTFFVTVNQNTSSCSLTFIPASPITWSTAFAANCACTNPEASAQLWRDGLNVTAENGLNVSLAAGTYSYTCNVSASQNYSAAANSSLYTINKAASEVNLLLNGSDGNLSIVGNVTVNITAYLIIPTSGNIELWINSSLANSGPDSLTNLTTFSPGTYNITALYPTTQNYSSSYETHWLIVANDTIPPTVSLSPASDQSLTSGQGLAVSCSATDNVAVASVNVTIDSLSICSGISDCSGSWTAQAGQWTLTCQARDAWNNSANKSVVLIVKAAPPYRPPTGPAARPPVVPDVFGIDITPEQPKAVDINIGPVKNITIAVSQEVRNASLNFSIRDCPDINTTRPIYTCFEIEHNLTNISQINITYCVNNSWIEGHNLSTSLLSRLTEGWDSLLTTEIGGDQNKTCFKAISPGLSWFAILGLTIPQICQPLERQCAGNVVQQCNIEGTGWVDLENCSYGCDSATKACLVAECEGSQRRCVDREAQVCGEGQWKTEQVCEFGCVDGVCVPADYTLLWIAAGLVIVASLVFLTRRKKKRIKFEIRQRDHRKKRIFKKEL